MTAVDRETMNRWREMIVVDRSGATVGTISEFYLDKGSRLPTWALLKTGLLGTRQTFVPLIGVAERNGELCLPYPRSQITSAPGVEIDGELTPDEEAVLFAHYGMDYWDDAVAEPRQQDDRDRDDAMTRSEEEVGVRTQRRPRERVRLQKYVVTEQETRTVPVRREEVRLVREPLPEQPQDETGEHPAG
ncbi:MAG TPA: DUF2382 domain-containing protein [Actinomycetes bacterium]